MVECDQVRLEDLSQMSPFGLGALEDVHCAFPNGHSLVLVYWCSPDSCVLDPSAHRSLQTSSLAHSGVDEE